MDFTHSEERQMLADTLNRWVAQDYPLAARLEAGASEKGFDPAKWTALADLGVIGALFDERNGGFGGAGFDLMVVFQAIGQGLIVEPLLSSGVLAGGVLAECGGEGLEDVLDGSQIGALAHFEVGDGWQIDAMTTTARKTAGGWELNGEKAVVRGAPGADFLIVSAQTGDGIALFRLPVGVEGLALRAYQTIDGGAAAEVMLNAVALPDDALLAGPERGEAVLESVLGRGLFCLCAEALGIMEVIRDMTVEYLQTRRQFGLPIGKFQALQHRMATLLIEIEQARAAVVRAAAALDEPGAARERALSAAKVTIGQVGTLVGEESIQMHGGIGMTWEHPLGHFVKRLILITQEMGDEDHHLMRYVALGRGDG